MSQRPILKPVQMNFRYQYLAYSQQMVNHWMGNIYKLYCESSPIIKQDCRAIDFRLNFNDIYFIKNWWELTE